MLLFLFLSNGHDFVKNNIKYVSAIINVKIKNIINDNFQPNWYTKGVATIEYGEWW